ncbi:MAG: hypothetical protein IPN94_00105 [Sphingobacteriales bacterium]|nr:hypothetical protein [Sphingobacteriales bacterium]
MPPLPPANPVGRKTVLGTAGPTLRTLGPVRFVGNCRRVKWGIAIAEAVHKWCAKYIWYWAKQIYCHKIKTYR